MALKSMTGFGEATVARKGIELTVSLSSVNRKQMDVNVRMPSAMTALEYRVQEMVKEQLSRGRVNGTITMDRAANTGGQSVAVDMDLAKAYVSELRKAGKELGLTDGLRTDVLLRVPGLISIEQKTGTEDVLPVLEAAVKAALKKLMTMRVQEGRELTVDLRDRLKTLEVWMKEITGFSETITVAYREKLIARLEKAGLENLAEDERVVKEIALFAGVPIWTNSHFLKPDPNLPSSPRSAPSELVTPACSRAHSVHPPGFAKLLPIAKRLARQQRPSEASLVPDPQEGEGSVLARLVVLPSR